MSDSPQFYKGQRLSYDSALCTVRRILPDGVIPNTKGPWLGVEWDDPTRGKHDGQLGGVRYFSCRSRKGTVASFVRPTRKGDQLRGVLGAVREKYQGKSQGGEHGEVEQVVISGKVAEEVGFRKVEREMGRLERLRVVVLERMGVWGVVDGNEDGAQDERKRSDVEEAQRELTETCPEIRELDLSYNPIETWEDIEDVAWALRELRILKLNSIRFRSLTSAYDESVFSSLSELHLNECLVTATDVIQILGSAERPRLPALKTLWLSQNELKTFRVSDESPKQQFGHVKTLMLENNEFSSLDELIHVLEVFPELKNISLQANAIEHFGGEFFKDGDETPLQYPTVDILNLAINNIQSFDFVDQLPVVFPNLSSLRISNNPVYANTNINTTSIDTNFFLTLARVPYLKTLNYTTITARDRDEGEIYYLSITEKDIATYLASVDLSTDKSRISHLAALKQKFPRYISLCEKHGRDSVLGQLTDPSTATNETQRLHKPVTHPPGSLAARLVNVRIYLSEPPPSPSPILKSATSTSLPSSPQLSFTKPLPTSLPSSFLYSLVSRHLRILPLQFTLVYESPELDPVRDDLTTRSQIYSSDQDKESGKGTGKTGPEKWKEWGDWDVDYLVDDNPPPSSDYTKEGNKMSGQTTVRGSNEAGEREAESGTWNAEGHLVRDGKKWKKRETEIPFGTRSWGEYLDLHADDAFTPGFGNGSGTRDVSLRVEVAGWYLR